jgi:hypothetical protein
VDADEGVDHTQGGARECQRGDEHYHSHEQMGPKSKDFKFYCIFKIILFIGIVLFSFYFLDLCFFRIFLLAGIVLGGWFWQGWGFCFNKLKTISPSINGIVHTRECGMCWTSHTSSPRCPVPGPR